jgi:DUF1680 family protein
MTPEADRVLGTEYALDGWLGQYLERITEQWIKVAPEANPGMLEMFRDRDRQPMRNIVAFAGEFPGKYLTGAVQVLRLTQDASLKAVLADFVGDLLALQDADGYLGPWQAGSHLTGSAPNSSAGGFWGVIGVSKETESQMGHAQSRGTWDAWGHYHIMLALMLWAEETGDAAAMRAARRMADLLCRTFLGTGKTLANTGDQPHTNLSPTHALCVLHAKTRTRRYLQLAEQTMNEQARDSPHGPIAGDYLHAALAGKDFHECGQPRWETLHTLMALPGLYYGTGDRRYRDAFEQIYWSLLKGDRHNNGGFTSGERAHGNPYLKLPIETCCTIAWLALSVEMLRLTGNSIVADEIELSTLNSVVGLHSPSGRWVTYDTPMDGLRVAAIHAIVMHAREGTPELNCCSVNGHRGLGMISDWALMRDAEDALVLNYYGPGSITTTWTPDRKIKLVQETTYPVEGNIKLTVHPTRATRFTLKLRIPYWSARSRVSVNGERIKGVAPGTYLAIDRKWKKGDRIELRLDMSEHFWTGEQECKGGVSMYRGPVLMTYDRRFNKVDPDDLPRLDARTLKRRRVRWKGKMAPIMLFEYRDDKGRKLSLCDFGSAGQAGSPYKSWLKISGTPSGRFSKENPLRSARL